MCVLAKVKEIKEGILSTEESVSKLPRHVKQKIADEALQRLKGLANANVSEQRGGYALILCRLCIFYSYSS